ncbi:MAG TPA: O-methyltransferase [Acidimicrobiales bacterium]|nr:O-methyltransferase [Acidimicrobiales bacterium]
MSDTWNAVDEYVSGLVVKPDAALDAALTSTAAAGMPPIAVSAAQGKLLHLIARMIGAERILEVGTLGGYSTIWMARALPASGRLISLEIDPRHGEVARANLARAGVDGVAEVRIGAALDTLPKLAEEKVGPFDLVFIDADKANIPEYFKWGLKLGRPGAVIVVDNVIRNGAVLDDSGRDANVAGVRRLNELLNSLPEVEATTVQTVGSKGYDGFTLAIAGRS